MRKILSEKLPRIIRNRKKLERLLNVRITNRGKEVFIEGSAEDEYVAEKVIDALNLGFPFSVALLIKKEGFVLEILNIKDYTTRKDLESVRGRIIGKAGRTLKTLSQLSDCYLELNENTVAIIGAPEDIMNAQEAIISIVKGSKQTNVYKFLEKSKSKPVGDLGLKE